MSRVNSETKNKLLIRRAVLNLLGFMVSIAAVVAILVHGEETSKPEFTGTVTVVSTCFIILYFFLVQYRREVLELPWKILFILITIVLFLFVTRVVSKLPGQNMIFLVPYAVIPVMVRTFYDARLAYPERS